MENIQTITDHPKRLTLTMLQHLFTSSALKHDVELKNPQIQGAALS